MDNSTKYSNEEIQNTDCIDKDVEKGCKVENKSPLERDKSDSSRQMTEANTVVMIPNENETLDKEHSLENGLPPKATNAIKENETLNNEHSSENGLPPGTTNALKTKETSEEKLCLENGLTSTATNELAENEAPVVENAKENSLGTGTDVYETNGSTDEDAGLENSLPPEATNFSSRNQMRDEVIIIENGRPTLTTNNWEKEFDETIVNISSRESTVIMSSRTLVSGSSLTRRRPTIDLESGQGSPSTAIIVDEVEEKLRKIPHFKRRKIYNIIKYAISIVLIILDVTFDWVEYTEMTTRGTYGIVTERQIDNIKFTYECEGSGETIQYVYMIFTIIGTVLSIGQICNISYQTVHEIKNTKSDRRFVHEYVETFVFLFVIEISQILLIMGFFDVCKLDCTIEKTELLLVVNSVISFLRLSWRWFSSCKCCTVYWKGTPHAPTGRRNQTPRVPSGRKRRSSTPVPSPRPHTPRARVNSSRECDCSGVQSILFVCLIVILFPIIVPFLPFVGIYFLLKQCSGTCCSCDVCNKRVNTSKSTRHDFKCERPCKCCILRCFPSRFEDPDTEACECTCKDCMACEQSCKCFLCRCFPSFLPSPEDDICECLCGECMNCESNCRCCFLRCFPSYLIQPKDEICTCRCGDCLAYEQPCKCFIFRCCPSHLIPPKNEICTCKCGDCMACELPCKCVTFRCCPSHLIPPKEEICTCRCGDCMACELPCKCVTFRCCPSHLIPPEEEICTCRCGDCMACELPCKCFTFRCCPSHLFPSKDDIWTCTCGECLTCELPCKCFTFRCFPTYLDPPKSDIWTCSCRECLACSMPCKCFIFRCFPEYLRTPHPDICTCLCAQCLSCKLPCPCFTCRCFPEQQGEHDWLTCTCGKCLSCERSCGCCICRVCPGKLIPPKDNAIDCICDRCLACQKDCICCICRCFPEVLEESNWCECKQCTCFKKHTVSPRQSPPTIAMISQPKPMPVQIPIPNPLPPQPIIIQPQPQPPPLPPTLTPPPSPPRPLPTPRPPLPRGKNCCKVCCPNCVYFLVAVALLFMGLLYLVYASLIAVQLQYVLLCTVNDTIMETTQVVFVRNFVKLFQL